MARTFHFIGLAALSFALTGCTSTDKYTAVKLENEQLRNELANSQNKASTAAAQAEAYQRQLAMLNENGAGNQALVTNLQQQNANLQAQNADLQARYEAALKNVGTGAVALPEVVTNALDAFAAQNTDLVDFDRARGIVKFKTDFTFATGSDQVTEKAKTALSRFAQILNSDAAKGYELMVAGHTDNTPVVQQTTKVKHPDNWYLSSHRAIAVGEELTKHQVSPQRLAVVGYADQRPIASNTTAAGKGQNRRVEVLILPSTVRSGVAAAAAKASANGSSPKKPGTINKDASVVTPTTPALNK